jgi:hypothetical protein
MGDLRNAHKILVGKSEEKRRLGRTRRRRKDNIKKYFNEIRCGDVDCICLAENTEQWRALVNSVMSL